ncbi:MAG: tyrosine-type recombinase/integrase [Deltaproteobacteria bacterium]|nr:tyrosine-type recombinase/integrase [Deltaproteobacteria bacterium]
MKRRPYGSGTIERLPSGRYRVKLPGTTRADRESLGPFPTHDEAQLALDAAAAELAARRAAATAGGALAGGITLRAYGAPWLDKRERAGVRDVRTDRCRWERHVLSASFADRAMGSISRVDVRGWIDELAEKRAMRNDKDLGHKLSPRTVQRCLNLLRCCLQDAVDHEIVATNPAKDVRVKGKIVDDWTYLAPEEQQAIATCEKIAEPERLRILFAMGTGLRKGEQWNIELADVDVSDDDPHVLVRYGGPNHQPPKRNKLRRVPLFGVALDAARRWLELLPSYATRNRRRLMWPTPRGARRIVTNDYGWHEQRKAAGISRNVRWHDLRHTCGSSLVAGWWGRRWSLIEVRDLLGHSSVTVTERYAHLAESALQNAANETTRANSPRIVHERGNGGGIIRKPNDFLNRWSPVRVGPGAPSGPERNPERNRRGLARFRAPSRCRPGRMIATEQDGWCCPTTPLPISSSRRASRSSSPSARCIPSTARAPTSACRCRCTAGRSASSRAWAATSPRSNAPRGHLGHRCSARQLYLIVTRPSQRQVPPVHSRLHWPWEQTCPKQQSVAGSQSYGQRFAHEPQFSGSMAVCLLDIMCGLLARQNVARSGPDAQAA